MHTKVETLRLTPSADQDDGGWTLHDLPFFSEVHGETFAKAFSWAGQHIGRGGLLQPHHPQTASQLSQQLGRCGFFNGPHDTRSTLLAREILAYHSPVADRVFAVQGAVVAALEALDGQEGSHASLPRLRDGSLLAGFQLPDERPASQPDSLRARREGEGYVLDGQCWVVSAGAPQVWLVVAQCEEAEAGETRAVFLLESDAPGLAVSSGDAGDVGPCGLLQLVNCRAANASRRQARGSQVQAALDCLRRFRVTSAAAALALARRAIDETRRIAGLPQTQGPSLPDEILQFTLADMYTALETACVTVYHAGWTHDTRPAAACGTLALASLAAVEAAQKNLDAATQVFGLDGFKPGSPIRDLNQEMAAMRLLEGASDQKRIVVAGALLRGEL